MLSPISSVGTVTVASCRGVRVLASAALALNHPTRGGKAIAAWVLRSVESPLPSPTTDRNVGVGGD
jgi:hypothetical protein